MLIGLFVEEGSLVYDMALNGFRLFSFGFLFMGMNIYTSALFTALSDGRVSALLSFCRTFVFIVGFLILLPLWLQMTGVWLSIPLAETVSFCMTLYYLGKYKNIYRFA